MIYYFLKEIKYYNLDEGTAREIAAVFKERIYDYKSGTSPTTALIDIAEKEFGLSRLAIPEQFKGNILQRMDEESKSGASAGATAEGDPEARRNTAVTIK